MSLTILRFAAAMFTAVALAAGFAHLLELPNKMALFRADYLTVRAGLSFLAKRIDPFAAPRRLMTARSGGGCVKVLIGVLVGLGFSRSATAHAQASDITAAVPAASASAAAWLALVDAGRYEVSWDSAATLFRAWSPSRGGRKRSRRRGLPSSRSAPGHS